MTATLKRVSHWEGGDVVFAKLRFEGKARILSTADLDCISLVDETAVSKDVWVDSFVDYARGDWPARDGIVTADVYWTMKGRQIPRAMDLRGAVLKIKVKPDFVLAGTVIHDPCFEFK